LNEHDDVIEMQTMKIRPPQNVLANSVPVCKHDFSNWPCSRKCPWQLLRPVILQYNLCSYTHETHMYDAIAHGSWNAL